MNTHIQHTEETNSLISRNTYSFSILSLLSNLQYYSKYKISYSPTLERIHYIELMNFLKNELSVLDKNLKQNKPSKFCEISAKLREIYYKKFVYIMYVSLLPNILNTIKDIMEIRPGMEANVTTLLILVPIKHILGATCKKQYYQYYYNLKILYITQIRS